LFGARLKPPADSVQPCQQPDRIDGVESKAIVGHKLLEVVSKGQIAFESKAQADEKAQHAFKYVSILKRSATQLSGARWGLETTSMQNI
jgi:hypothetical protein